MNRSDSQSLQIVVVTGLSGSGKSTVSRVLEDMGFYCIDNLPIALVPSLAEMASGFLPHHSKIALVMDLRDRALLRTFPEVFRQLQKEGMRLEILFLEAVANLSAIALDNARFHKTLQTNCDLMAAHKYRIDDN